MGFLLGGIGDINAKREQNFLIVTKGAWGGWGRESFCPQFTPPPSPNPDTTVTQVEDAFKHFTSRPDIAIILITQSVRVRRAIGVVVVASALILTSPSSSPDRGGHSATAGQPHGGNTRGAGDSQQGSALRSRQGQHPEEGAGLVLG